jgi:hypothetical protein
LFGLGDYSSNLTSIATLRIEKEKRIDICLHSLPLHTSLHFICSSG